jgi:predicted butyrate kinase (DUF1464 family)
VSGTPARTVRVAGTDPGTSSLDVLVLQDGAVTDQQRFTPAELDADACVAVRWLRERGPFDLIAGPSGYGLPLVRAADCTRRDRDLMSLVRADEQSAPGRRGVAGFASLVRALCESALPVVFLPGVIHLPTVPGHRKLNRIDMGTPDKLCVAALALALRAAERRLAWGDYCACVVEMGSVFTACVALSGGQVVDGAGGTSGPVGWGSSGAWDGEVAYLLSPLSKRDLFSGGVTSAPEAAAGRRRFVESLVQHVAGLRAVTAFDEVVLSGRLLQTEPALTEEAEAGLAGLAPVVRLTSLPGAWVKHTAQGAALIADGLTGGRWEPLVDHLRLRQAGGTVFDHLCHPRAAEARPPE